MYFLVPTTSGETPHGVTIQPLTFIGVAILVFMVLLLLVAIALASAGLFIRRLVFNTQILVNACIKNEFQLKCIYLATQLPTVLL